MKKILNSIIIILLYLLTIYNLFCLNSIKNMEHRENIIVVRETKDSEPKEYVLATMVFEAFLDEEFAVYSPLYMTKETTIKFLDKQRVRVVQYLETEKKKRKIQKRLEEAKKQEALPNG